MFKAIVRFSIRKKLFVGLTTLFLFIGGIYAMLTLPIDAVPDIICMVYQQASFPGKPRELLIPVARLSGKHRRAAPHMHGGI